MTSLAEAAALVEGMEIGSARLIVASLDLHEASAPVSAEHAHA